MSYNKISISRELQDYIDDVAPELNMLGYAELMRHPVVVNFNKPAKKASANKTGSKKPGTAKLSGSVKQKAWAAQIRADFKTNFKTSHPSACEVAKDYKTSAAKWIDNRSCLTVFANRIQTAYAAIVDAERAFDAELEARDVKPGQQFDYDDGLNALRSKISSARTSLITIIS